LDDEVTKTRDLGNSIKRRIEALKKRPTPRGQEARKNQVCGLHARSALRLVLLTGNGNEQVNVLAQKFMTALQSYTQAEKDYRQKQRTRMERQFKIGQS